MHLSVYRYLKLLESITVESEKNYFSAAMISQSEVSYFVEGILQGVRADGRSCDSMRRMSIELGVVPTANGSCRIQSRACDVIVAIKSEIGRPLTDRPSEGIASVSVEFGCSALPRQSEFAGRQAAAEADSASDVLSRHLTDLCIASMDKTQLCIEPSKACWILSIDVLVERIDGPLVDPISIAIRGALMDLELPIVTSVNDPGNDREESGTAIPRVELSDALWTISPSNMSAICLSVGIYGNGSIFLIDLDRIEDSIAKFKNNCLLTVSVNDNGECCGIHKFGNGSVNPAVVCEVVEATSIVGKQISELLVKLAKAKLNS